MRQMPEVQRNRVKVPSRQLDSVWTENNRRVLPIAELVFEFERRAPSVVNWQVKLGSSHVVFIVRARQALS